MLEQYFGKKVRELRIAAGLSQQQLSDKSDIIREQISKIENGQCNCTLETMEKLANALKVNPSILVDFPFVEKNLVDFEKNKLHPVVKWAGGKTQILDKIKSLMPQKIGNYFEPFVGGGALLFSLVPHKATINDFNEELIDVYRCFQNDQYYSKFIELLTQHEQKHCEDYYMSIRSMDRDKNFKDLPIFVRAARMVYLNKACFNGLYRVNSQGFFNVPSGKKKKVIAFDRENFEAIHSYFSTCEITIKHGDFEPAVDDAKAGDFVYFDPPYDVYKADGFTSYTDTGFGPNEQRRLAAVYDRLTKKGVKCLLSNHNTKLIQELYKDYNIHVILAKRMINSDAKGRGDVEEVLVANY